MEADNLLLLVLLLLLLLLLYLQQPVTGLFHVPG